MPANSNAPNYNAFADFLLGDLSESNYSVLPVTATPTNNRFGFFITDDWKPTSKLTVNMGLRYDLDTLYQNSPGNMANFYPKLDELVTLQGTGRPDLFSGIPIVSGSSVGLNAGNYIGADHTMFSPRLGIAYRPFKSNRLVLRGGYGLYYVSIPWVWGSMQLARNAPYAAEEQYNAAAGLTPTLNFSDPFPSQWRNQPALRQSQRQCSADELQVSRNSSMELHGRIPDYAQLFRAHQLPGKRVGTCHATVQPERPCDAANSGRELVSGAPALSTFWRDHPLVGWLDNQHPATASLGASPLCLRAFVRGRV